MFEHYPSLLVTKLYIPHLRSSHVSRASLLAGLDASVERKLILVAAAAGFGKTTLMADWSRQRAEAVAWLSLDEGDNDPARFLSYLVASIQTRRPQVGQELLAALQSPQPPTTENTLRVLINQLAAAPEGLILVLDDYHVIVNPAIHEALAFLLEHLPQQVTMVLLTRTDPPLPVARLRAKNDLLELRADALRFSVDETGQFLNDAMHIGLTGEAVSALDARTEGWIAGLQLAAVAMQSAPGDKQSFVRDFTGSHRFVLDYLMEEVLAQQPDDVRRFLLYTSILRRVNGVLCSAVMGEVDGQAMIEHLEKNNLFLIPLDGARYWYRYHHLFADLLQARLQAEYPQSLAELRQRAARWHEANGFPEEAVGYALEAQDFQYAARLITETDLTRRGEVTTLLEWYRAFPREFVADHVQLSAQFGVAFALSGRWEEAETLLSFVEQQTPEFRPEEYPVLAYLVASYRQDENRLGEITVELSATPQPTPVTKMVLAMLVSMSGDFQAACDLLAQAQAGSERAGDFALALTARFHQCRFHVFLGNLHQAYELSQGALEHIREAGSTALPMATFAHVSLGRIWIEWNGLDNAEHHLRQAIRLAETSGFVIGTGSSATMMLAEVKQARGDTQDAVEAARDAITLAERYDPPAEVEWLKTYQARLWAIQGSVAEAAQWLAEREPLPMSLFYPNSIEIVTRARVLVAQRKPEEAIAILTRLLAQARDLLTVEALGILALARQAQGDSVHAMLTLEQALTSGETENRVRAFLDLGYPMATLLARFCETHPDHAYARTALAAFPANDEASPPVEPLSEREIEVLRLIVAGYSNEEIAKALTLAMSTVKWYVNTLYSKLHVKTRSQAIARVHELKLLVD